MPSVRQFSAGQNLTGLRIVLDCTSTATALRHGPHVAPAGPGVTWLAYLCAAHADALPDWPGTPISHDDTGMKCGTLLDFRPPEELLRSHADLWLIPLTGVDPQVHGGDWAAVLEEADRVVRGRMGEDAGEDDPLYNLVTLMSIASKAVDDPFQLAVSLSHCETFARRALAAG